MIYFMNNEAKNFAHNIRILMEYHGDTQTTLSNKSGVSQKTISNMLNPGENKSPTLDNVSKIASAYRLQAWHLMIPTAPLDILINSSIEKIVENYVIADKGARDAVTQISELTAKYQKTA